jgi:hypothetical protein
MIRLHEPDPQPLSNEKKARMMIDTLYHLVRVWSKPGELLPTGRLIDLQSLALTLVDALEKIADEA